MFRFQFDNARAGRRGFWYLAPLLALGLAGCGLTDDDDELPTFTPPPVQNTKLRVVHASPDAPKVNVVVSGNTLLSNVDYEAISPLTTVAAAAYSVSVNAITPTGTPTVLGPVTLSLAADKIYTALAVGSAANLALEVLAIDDVAVASGQTRVTVYHAAPNAPQVDVYVTAPTDPLTQASPLGSFAFKQSLGPVSVANADYRIRVTPAGDKNTVVFDSGTVPLAGGDLLIVATENILNTELGASYSPINLLVSSGTGNATILRDAMTPSALRVVHASPDAPAVDVVVNNDLGSPLVNALAYPDFTGYVTVPADSYNVKVVADADNSIVAINADLDLQAGAVASVLAVGNLANIEPLVLTDNRRRVATEARVRLVHGSPTAGPVDIYVVAPGTVLTNVTPAFSNVPFKAETGYVSLAAGAYDVVITPTGSKTAAIGPLAVNVEAGGIYTAIARDEVGGGLPLGVILLDDFVVL